jgi:hypothetical protein
MNRRIRNRTYGGVGGGRSSARLPDGDPTAVAIGCWVGIGLDSRKLLDQFTIGT